MTDWQNVGEPLTFHCISYFQAALSSPLPPKRQPETKKTTRLKQRVVFHLQQSPSLFRFHFHAATLGVVARSGGGVFGLAQFNVFAIHALFFQERLHRLGAFFG